jgi:hypothetical protein
MAREAHSDGDGIGQEWHDAVGCGHVKDEPVAVVEAKVDATPVTRSAL